MHVLSCKYSSENRVDTSAQWPLDHPSSDGSRTIEENMAISKLPKSKRKWNVVNAPLFPTIPLSRLVLNNLHLFLQVFNVLMDCLTTNLMRMCACVP